MRQTIREIEVNVAYRWFVGYDLFEKIPHAKEKHGMRYTQLRGLLKMQAALTFACMNLKKRANWKHRRGSSPPYFPRHSSCHPYVNRTAPQWIFLCPRVYLIILVIELLR